MQKEMNRNNDEIVVITFLVVRSLSSASLCQPSPVFPAAPAQPNIFLMKYYKFYHSVVQTVVACTV